MKVDVSREENLLFLIDTGADISLLKGEKLIDTTEFDPEGSFKVKCVDGSPIRTHGTLEARIGLDSSSISHNFHLVGNQVDIPCDGILGRDFFHSTNPIICYASRTVTLRGKRYAMVGQRGRTG
jgi:hypothetical protein